MTDDEVLDAVADKAAIDIYRMRPYDPHRAVEAKKREADNA